MDFSSLQKKFSDSETFLSLLPHTPDDAIRQCFNARLNDLGSEMFPVTGLICIERKTMIEDIDSVGKHLKSGSG
jgi:hypothetical protein